MFEVLFYLEDSPNSVKDFHYVILLHVTFFAILHELLIIRWFIFYTIVGWTFDKRFHS